MLVSGITNRLLQASKQGFRFTGLKVDDWGTPFVNQALPAGLTAAYEGTMFVARATPAAGGTGVALGVTTAFVDTTPAAVLQNAQAAGGKDVIPVYIRGRVTAAGANTTSVEASFQVDNINRVTSGGSALGNIHCTNPSNTTASVTVPTVGAILSPAASSARRYLGSALVKVATAPTWTVNDVFIFTFGAPGQFVTQAPVIAAGTTVLTAHIPFAAASVPPGGSLSLHFANVANSATPPSIEFEICWIER